MANGCYDMMDELVGRMIEIVEATDKQHMGIKGCIVDETKNMLMIESNNKVKKIPKKCIKFRITDSNVIVDGSKICYRPEDRIKKCFRRLRKEKKRKYGHKYI